MGSVCKSLFAALCFACALPAWPQGYPSRPIRMMVGFAPGGTNDILALVALAKSKPGKLTYASSGNGSTLHFGGELFKVLAGVHIVHIPYKGNAPALTDVMGGQVDMTFSAVPPALPHVKGGKLRMLGVSTAKRMPGLEDVPTIAEAGVPGYEMSTWYGAFAPGGTPAPIVERLANEVAKALADPQVREQFLAQGVEPKANTPAEFRRLVSDEIAKWTKLVKASGIRAD